MANPSPLTTDVQAQINKLAKQITVAHQLDAEIQAELISHMEDKVEGYLTGQEKISTDDALLLTRTHFGNPGVIKSLLQGVHMRSFQLSLAHRLMSAAIITVVAEILTNVLFGFIQYLILDNIRGDSSLYIGLDTLVILVGNCGVLLFAFGLGNFLIRKKANILAKFKLWHLGIMLLLLIILSQFVDYFAFLAILQNKSTFSMDTTSFRYLFVITRFVSVLVTALVGIFWLWWCDESPRNWRSSILTAGALFAFYEIQTGLSLIRYYLASDAYGHTILNLFLQHPFWLFIMPMIITTIGILLSIPGFYLYIRVIKPHPVTSA